ncbi:MAG: hypothetical protein M0Z77_08850 [Thermoplasmatales archaeon]|nr:hypothetical protein [Thermoplasmatales archaeon]
MTGNPIIKSGVRILRPSEYETLRKVLKPQQQILVDSLLLTGMRYEEILRFREHEEWMDGNSIHLPEWAQKKVKRRQLERWIRLSIRGKAVIPNLFLISVPQRSSFDHSLRRWVLRTFKSYNLDPAKISAKTFRKTWDSWLMAYYDKAEYIYLSQGHNQMTSLRHYLGIPFTEEDKLGMRDWVEGWI